MKSLPWLHIGTAAVWVILAALNFSTGKNFAGYFNALCAATWLGMAWMYAKLAERRRRQAAAMSTLNNLVSQTKNPEPVRKPAKKPIGREKPLRDIDF
jgi:hypothetical protein